MCNSPLLAFREHGFFGLEGNASKPSVCRTESELYESDEWPSSSTIRRSNRRLLKGPMSRRHHHHKQMTFIPSPLHRFGLHLTREQCRVIDVHDESTITMAWKDLGDEGQPPGFLYTICKLYRVQTRKDQYPLMKRLLLDEYLLVTTVGDTGLDEHGRPLVKLHVDPVYTSERGKASVLGGMLCK